MNCCIHNINGRGNWMVRGCRARRFTEMLLATSLMAIRCTPYFRPFLHPLSTTWPHPPSDLSLSLAPRRRNEGHCGSVALVATVTHRPFCESPPTFLAQVRDFFFRRPDLRARFFSSRSRFFSSRSWFLSPRSWFLSSRSSTTVFHCRFSSSSRSLCRDS